MTLAEEDKFIAQLQHEQEFSPRISAEEFERLPDCRHRELLDGLVKESQLGAESILIATMIARIIGNYLASRNLGFVFVENLYRMTPSRKNNLRRPDVSFVALDRLPGGRIPRGIMSLAPDLAIEVVSPVDLVEELATKVQEYLDAGVRLVWIVHPVTRTVVIHHGNGVIAAVGQHQDIDGGEVLPGFSSPVKDFFPPIENTTPIVRKSDV